MIHTIVFGVKSLKAYMLDRHNTVKRRRGKSKNMLVVLGGTDLRKKVAVR